MPIACVPALAPSVFTPFIPNPKTCCVFPIKHTAKTRTSVIVFNIFLFFQIKNANPVNTIIVEIVIPNHFAKPVDTPIITCALEESLSLFSSSIALSLLLIPIDAIFVIVPTLLLLTSLVNIKLTSLFSPTFIVCCDKLFVYKLPLLSYQSLFSSDLNFNPSGNLSVIKTAFPGTSPLFVIIILYSITTVAPSICFLFISTFANCLLSYVYVFVFPSFVCTVILLIYFCISKSNFLFSTNPISIFFKFDSAVNVFVKPAVTFSPSIPIVFVTTSEFLLSITPSF